ncbi:MAG: hypothetical protein U0Q18_35845 [Bryobacteraceae bacterium]
MIRLLVLALAALGQTAADPDAALPRILWREPPRMTEREWTCGPGGCDRMPAAPFRFLKEDTTGSSPKLTVKDAHGRNWSVKFGAEVIPECFAARFITALGYLGEPAYYVGTGRIEGAQNLKRVRRVVAKDGTFAKARFELRGERDLEFIEGRAWSWTDNPFRGTHELDGLRIVMMLLSNWDAKDARDGDESNTGVFRWTDGERKVLAFGVFDWGASLGTWGGAVRRDQSDCAGYTKDTPDFVKGVKPDGVSWGFSGKHTQSVTAGISVDDVRWLLPYLLRITPGQLRAGLKASGATDRQAGCWSGAIQNRIRQLQAVAR